MTKTKKYFLDTDQDSHWYLVEADHRAEWNAWCDLDQDDEAAWTPPTFAKPIGCFPGNIEFELHSPTTGGGPQKEEEMSPRQPAGEQP